MASRVAPPVSAALTEAATGTGSPVRIAASTALRRWLPWIVSTIAKSPKAAPSTVYGQITSSSERKGTILRTARPTARTPKAVRHQASWVRSAASIVRRGAPPAGDWETGGSTGVLILDD